MWKKNIQNIFIVSFSAATSQTSSLGFTCASGKISTYKCTFRSNINFSVFSFQPACSPAAEGLPPRWMCC